MAVLQTEKKYKRKSKQELVRRTKVCVGVCVYVARTFWRLYRNFLELVQDSTTLCNYCLPTVYVCVCVHVHGADTSVGVSCFIVFDSRPMIAIGIC